MRDVVANTRNVCCASAASRSPLSSCSVSSSSTAFATVASLSTSVGASPAESEASRNAATNASCRARDWRGRARPEPRERPVEAPAGGPASLLGEACTRRRTRRDPGEAATCVLLVGMRDAEAGQRPQRVHAPCHMCPSGSMCPSEGALARQECPCSDQCAAARGRAPAARGRVCSARRRGYNGRRRHHGRKQRKAFERGRSARAKRHRSAPGAVSAHGGGAN